MAATFWNNFKNTALSVQNKKLFVFSIIFSVLTYPLTTIIAIVNEACNASDYDGFIGVSILAGVGLALITIIAAIGSFKELWKKTTVDMIYALPMTANQRFLSHFFGGLSIVLIPFTAGGILSIIMVAVSKIFISIDFTIGNVVETILIAILLVIVIYTICVFVINCCGTLFEIIYSTIMCYSVIPITLLLLDYRISNNLIGMNNSIEFLQGYTNPLGILFYGIDIIETTKGFYLWFFTCLAIYVAIFFASKAIYVRRKAEQVSLTFVHKSLFYGMLIILTIGFVGSIYDTDSILSAPALFSIFIIYMTFEVIANRGFKKIHFPIIRFVATVIISFSFVAIATKTGMFGQETSVPMQFSVNSIEINYTLYNDNDINENIDCTIAESEIISEIISIHKDVTEEISNDVYHKNRDINDSGNHRYFKPETYGYTYVNFEYTTNFGRKISRYYSVQNSKLDKLTEDIKTSKSYAEDQARKFSNKIRNSFTSTIKDNGYKDTSTQSIKVNYIYGHDEGFIQKEETTVTIKQKQIDKLLDEVEVAYAEDYYENTVNWQNGLPLYSIGYSDYITINEYCTRTIEVLEKYGLVKETTILSDNSRI